MSAIKALLHVMNLIMIVKQGMASAAEKRSKSPPGTRITSFAEWDELEPNRRGNRLLRIWEEFMNTGVWPPPPIKVEYPEKMKATSDASSNGENNEIKARITIYKIKSTDARDVTECQLALVGEQSLDVVMMEDIADPQTDPEFHTKMTQKRVGTKPNVLFLNEGGASSLLLKFAEFLEKMVDETRSMNQIRDDIRELLAHEVWWSYTFDTEHHFETVMDKFEKSSKRVHPQFCNIMRTHYNTVKERGIFQEFTDKKLKNKIFDRKFVNDVVMYVACHCHALVMGTKMEAQRKLLIILGSVEQAEAIWDPTSCIEHFIKYADVWPGDIIKLINERLGSTQKSKTVDRDIIKMIGDHTHLVAPEVYKITVFMQIWKHLIKLKSAGFTGDIGIAHHKEILTDDWLRTLYGIWGVKHTDIQKTKDIEPDSDDKSSE